KPYILMGTRADDKIYAKSTIQILPDNAAIRAKLMIGLYTDDGAGHQLVSSAGTLSGTIVSFVVPIASVTVQDYGVVLGLDRNGNGQFSTDESPRFGPKILKVVSQEAYTSSMNALTDAMNAISLFTVWKFRPISRN